MKPRDWFNVPISAKNSVTPPYGPRYNSDLVIMATILSHLAKPSQSYSL